MREGARADTCGYHPTPAIKPRHHEKPSNLTHLLPPSDFSSGWGKKKGKKYSVLGLTAKFSGNDITNRRHVYASEEVTRRFRAKLRFSLARRRNFKGNCSPTCILKISGRSVLSVCRKGRNIIASRIATDVPSTTDYENIIVTGYFSVCMYKIWNWKYKSAIFLITRIV